MAIQQANLSSLTAELSQTRSDLQEQYKIQSSNSQRLLSLTDTLRGVEEKGREEKEELSTLRREVEGLRERARWHREVVEEKERQVVVRCCAYRPLALDLSSPFGINSSCRTNTRPFLSSCRN